MQTRGLYMNRDHLQIKKAIFLSVERVAMGRATSIVWSKVWPLCEAMSVAIFEWASLWTRILMVTSRGLEYQTMAVAVFVEIIRQ